MKCPHCNSKSIVKHGFVQGTQRYRCNKCRKNFTEKTFQATYRHQFTSDQIRGAIALLLLTNASTRAAEVLLTMFFGKKVSHMSPWRWVQKFKDKLEFTSKRFRKVHAGRIWHVDEVFIKVRGSTSKKDFSYLVIVRDQHGTILAVKVGHERDSKLIEHALISANLNAKKKPAVIVSDKYSAYPPAIKEEFPKKKIRESPKHVTAHFHPKIVQHKGRKYKLTNNPVERTNSSFREWYHGKRGFKSLSSAQRSIEAWAAARNARNAGVEFWNCAFT